MIRYSIAFCLCFVLHSWLRAELDSARVFPSSLRVWCQIPDAKIARERWSSGGLAGVSEKILQSVQWSQILKNTKIDNHIFLMSTGLQLNEILDALQGELAVGLFEEDGAQRWCLFLDARSEIVAVEILRSNLEKEFVKNGYTRVEKRFGDSYTYSWSQGEKCLLAYAIHVGLGHPTSIPHL
jgi:hypothetical protein